MVGAEFLVQIVGRIDPGMLESFMGGHSSLGLDGQAAFDEVSSGRRDTMPVLGWGERIICCKDGLHLFQVGVAIKGGVTAQQEIGDYADGPYISNHE